MRQASARCKLNSFISLFILRAFYFPQVELSYHIHTRLGQKVSCFQIAWACIDGLALPHTKTPAELICGRFYMIKGSRLSFRMGCQAHQWQAYHLARQEQFRLHAHCGYLGSEIGLLSPRLSLAGCRRDLSTVVRGQFRR